MFLNILIQASIYIVLIALIHYLYLFFRNNLTIPKIKDLVNKPKENYKKMYTIIEKNKVPDNVMKDELKDYFKSLNKAPGETSTNNSIPLTSNSIPLTSNSTPLTNNSMSFANTNNTIMSAEPTSSSYSQF